MKLTYRFNASTVKEYKILKNFCSNACKIQIIVLSSRYNKK